MLMAESYPSWFTVPYQGNRLGMQMLFPRGFSANLVLLVWSFLGSVIMYGFLCNFRPMLLLPVLETPVDTAEDILHRGLIPFTHPWSGFYIDILRKSSDPIDLQLGNVSVRSKDNREEMKMLDEYVHGAGTHVYISNTLNGAHNQLGPYHWSKDKVKGVSPYTGWLVNKRWTLNDELAVHLLRWQQVCFCLCKNCLGND